MDEQSLDIEPKDLFAMLQPTLVWVDVEQCDADAPVVLAFATALDAAPCVEVRVGRNEECLRIDRARCPHELVQALESARTAP